MKRLKAGAKEYIDDKFLLGDFSKIKFITNHLEQSDISFDIDKLKKEIYYAEREWEKNDPQMDAYIAPKLHSILDISRSQATDSGFWKYLTIVEFRKFVRHRWANADGKVSIDRYWGSKRRNALCRLWWAAELTERAGNFDLTIKLLSGSGQDQYEWFLMGSKFSNYPEVLEPIIETLIDEKRDVYRNVIENFNRLLTTVLLESLGKESIREILITLKKAYKEGKKPNISSLDIFATKSNTGT
ncbi:DUF6339 family protein [Aliifodinibius salicampi]|uniref:DUF6339 family protein n=1 Tax=Fodinibius salicampi TaxID=1920655 RepID=A0ABT3PY26_9BACT|nr:DUF6339 family protein [Fodinibius salicampi]MCW9712681.1 DUF6339 family protein [Fodinibius salicampi]